MPIKQLDNLVSAGQMQVEPFAQDEFDGLIQTATSKLVDAGNASNSLIGRTSLAYDACHSLALAALRKKGYRSDNRYQVFQALAHTSSITSVEIRILSDAHNKRNKAEYSGRVDVSEAAVKSLIEIGLRLLSEFDP